MVYYATLTLKTSEVQKIGESGPFKSLRLFEMYITREECHKKVDKFFDEFEKWCNND